MTTEAPANEHVTDAALSEAFRVVFGWLLKLRPPKTKRLSQLHNTAKDNKKHAGVCWLKQETAFCTDIDPSILPDLHPEPPLSVCRFLPFAVIPKYCSRELHINVLASTREDNNGFPSAGVNLEKWFYKAGLEINLTKFSECLFVHRSRTFFTKFGFNDMQSKSLQGGM